MPSLSTGASTALLSPVAKLNDLQDFEPEFFGPEMPPNYVREESTTQTSSENDQVGISI